MLRPRPCRLRLVNHICLNSVPRSRKSCQTTARSCAQNNSGTRLFNVLAQKPPPFVAFKRERRAQEITSAARPQIRNPKKGGHRLDTRSASLPSVKETNLKRFWDFQQWTPRGRGLFLLNGLVMLCASNWVILKAANNQFDPFTFALLRFSVAAVAFWPFLKGADADIRKAGLELGCWSGLAYLLQAEGMLTTNASRASFLSAFTVLVVPMLSGLSGKGVRPVTWLSALVAFGGMGLLEHGGEPAGIGDVLSLLSAFFFGIQVFRTEHYSRTLGPSASMPLMAVVLMTILVMSFGAAVVTHADQAAAVALHPSLLGKVLGRLTLQNLLPILWTGICSTDAVLLIEMQALQDVDATDAAIMYSLEPVAGAALAWGFLGERWTGLAWVGALLIVGSSIAAQLFSQDDRAAAQRQE